MVLKFMFTTLLMLLFLWWTSYGIFDFAGGYVRRQINKFKKLK